MSEKPSGHWGLGLLGQWQWNRLRAGDSWLKPWSPWVTSLEMTANVLFGILFQNFSEKKKIDSTWDFRPENGEVQNQDQSVSLTSQDRAAGSPNLPRPERRSDEPRQAGSGPYGFGSVATTWGRQRPRRPGPRLFMSYCTSGESLVEKGGSSGD